MFDSPLKFAQQANADTSTTTVQISYDLRTEGVIEKRELPFVVGIFADLSGDRIGDNAPPSSFNLRTMVEIDFNNFNSVMAMAQAMVNLGAIKRTLPKEKIGDKDTLDGNLLFTSLDDFSPMAIVKAVPLLNHWYGQRGQGNSSTADIDLLLTTQLQEIMHSPSFQALEATWRSMHGLVAAVDTNAMLKIKVFNATKDELWSDMEKAVQFDQSTLFKLIYGSEYDTYGGCPYGLLLGGFEIGSSSRDISFLNNIAAISAAAHVPFISAASASLFGLDSFHHLPKPRDLSKIFESPDLIEWRDFCEGDNALYVSLVLPHVLLRLPYRKSGFPVEEFEFEELAGDSASEPNSDHFLWGNAAYLLAQRIMSAFSIYHWTAAIHGIEDGGLVENLPLYQYRNMSGMTVQLCPTTVPITDRRANELTNLGFIPLCHCKGSTHAAFISANTCFIPKKYFDNSTNEHARICAKLPYVLAASRFMHYIKIIMRNKLGGFLSRDKVEDSLNDWISDYVFDDASISINANKPLRNAKVIVTDEPGSPGAYTTTVFLQPHFQLPLLTIPMKFEIHYNSNFEFLMSNGAPSMLTRIQN